MPFKARASSRLDALTLADVQKSKLFDPRSRFENSLQKSIFQNALVLISIITAPKHRYSLQPEASSRAANKVFFCMFLQECDETAVKNLLGGDHPASNSDVNRSIMPVMLCHPNTKSAFSID